jgi:hypothetical protein
MSVSDLSEMLQFVSVVKHVCFIDTENKQHFWLNQKHVTDRERVRYRRSDGIKERLLVTNAIKTPSLSS